MKHITSPDGTVFEVAYRGVVVDPVITTTDGEITFRDTYDHGKVRKNEFVHKVSITLHGDNIQTVYAVYSERDENGEYNKREFQVTPTATNIFGGNMIRFNSELKDSVSFWFHIRVIHGARLARRRCRRQRLGR